MNPRRVGQSRGLIFLWRFAHPGGLWGVYSDEMLQWAREVFDDTDG